MLEEDEGFGDITSNAVVEENKEVSAHIVSKDEGILAGIDVIRNVLHTMEERNGKLLICGLHEQPLKVFLESEVSEKIEIAEKSE